jgi:peptidoglycan/LPS O-acetylase OafA/YrhL
MTTEATASRRFPATPPAWLLPLAGAVAAGWLIGSFQVRTATHNACDDFGPRACGADDFAPSVLGLAGLLVLLLLLAAAGASAVKRRRGLAFAAPLVCAGASATVTAFAEQGSEAGWYLPTLAALAIGILLLAAGLLGTPARSRISAATADPDQVADTDPS